MALITIISLGILILFIYSLIYISNEPTSDNEVKLKILKLKRQRSRSFVKNGFIISIIFIFLFRGFIDYQNQSGFFDINGFSGLTMFIRLIGNIMSITVISFLISIISNYFKKFEVINDENKGPWNNN